MRSSRVQHRARFTCATGSSWTVNDDLTSRDSEYRLQTVAISAAVLRLRSWSLGDDCASLGRRSATHAGARREACWRRVDHSASTGNRCGSDEDWWRGGTFLLDRSQPVHLSPAPRFTAARVHGIDSRASNRWKDVVYVRAPRSGMDCPRVRRDSV